MTVRHRVDWLFEFLSSLWELKRTTVLTLRGVEVVAGSEDNAYEDGHDDEHSGLDAADMEAGIHRRMGHAYVAAEYHLWEAVVHRRLLSYSLRAKSRDAWLGRTVPLGGNAEAWHMDESL